MNPQVATVEQSCVMPQCPVCSIDMQGCLAVSTVCDCCRQGALSRHSCAYSFCVTNHMAGSVVSAQVETYVTTDAA